MTGILFETITFTNVWGIHQETVNYLDQGLVLVLGRNGAGKSSLFIEGPFYLAYGRSFRFGDRPSDKVINDHADEKEDSLVEGWINVDGTRYRIVRARRSKVYNKGLSVFSESGADLSRGTTDETQEWLNHLLGMGPDTFRHSVVFNHEILKFPLLGDTEKKKVFDEILQLDAFAEALETTRKEVNTLKLRKKTEEGTLKTLKERLQKVESDYRSTLKSEDTWEEGRASRVESLVDAVELAKGELIKAEKEMARLETKESATMAGYSENDVSDLEDTLREEVEGLAEFRKIVAEKKAKLKEKISTAQRDITKREALLSAGECPQCGSQIDSKRLSCAELKETLARLQAKMANLEEIETTDGNTIVQNVETLRKQIQELKEKNKAAVQAVEKVREQKRFASNDVVHAKSAVREAEMRLNTEKSAENPYTKLAENQKARLEEATDDHSLAATTLVSTTKKLVDEEVLEHVFSNKGAKLILLQEALPLLNAEASRLQRIMDIPIGAKFSLKGVDEARGGNFHIEIFNPNGSSTYEGDSSGEKSCVDLILLLSLLSLASKRGRKVFSQNFFDEAFDKLDDVNETAVLRVLQDIGKTKSSVFVLSHSAERIGGQMDKVWVVENGKVIQ